MSDKKCSQCGEIKPINDFTTRSRSGKIAPSSWCKPCKRQISRDKRREGNWKIPSNEQLEKWRLKGIADRQKAEKAGRFILEDCRKSDKKRGLANDLDRTFVDEMIAQPCSYCGDTDLRMTLDRIDNDIGHTKANVVPACYRCNIIRRDMPYDAWLRFRDVLRETREAGLFGDWCTKPMARKSRDDSTKH